MRRELLVGVLLCFFVLALATSPSHALVLCARAKADGTISATLKVRDACRAKEVQLNPVALGLQGPVGPPGPSGGPGTLLKDANGAFIGSLLDTVSSYGGPTVIRKEGALLLLLLVQPDASGFSGIGADSAAYFETPDCSGQAYLRPGIGPPALFRLTRAAVDPIYPLTTLYYPGDPIVSKILGSRMESGGCLTFPTPFTDDVGPTQILDLSGYVTPLRLE